MAELVRIGSTQALANYVSGTNVLTQLNQDNITSISNTTSGINTSLINLQNYTSGVEALRRAMVSSSAAGDKVEITITQNGHGFTSGVWLYRATDSSYKKAKADTEVTADVVGVISDVPTINSFKLVTAGSVTGIFTGLTDGNRYFLSAASDGGMTNSDPANSSDSWVSKPVLHATSATGGIVHIERGSVAVSGNTTVDLPLNYLTGFETAPYTTSGISIGTGSCRSKEVLNDQYNIVSNSTFVKKLTGPFVAGTFQNGIDSGNREASTTYHVYKITDGTSIDTLYSKSPTSPTMPSGYVAARRIMSFKTDSTGWIPNYTQNGNEFRWASRVLDVSAAEAPNNTFTLITLTVPSGFPVYAMIRIVCKSATINDDYKVKDATSTESTGPFRLYQVCQVANQYNAVGEGIVKTNSSAQVYHTANQASVTVSLITDGWIDTRGRDS